MRQGLTPQQIADYQRQHPGAKQTEIAQHFGVSARHIRNLQKQVNQCDGGAARPRRARRVSAPPAPRSTVARTIRLSAGLVSRSGTLWRCPKCRELMRPLPGTRSEDWNDRGCYLHQAQPNTLQRQVEPVEPVEQSAPEVPIMDLSVNNERNIGTIAPQCDISASAGTAEVNELRPDRSGDDSASASRLARIEGQIIVKEKIIIVRPGVLSIIGTLPPQMLVAIVASVLIILLCIAQSSGVDPWSARP